MLIFCFTGRPITDSSFSVLHFSASLQNTIQQNTNGLLIVSRISSTIFQKVRMAAFVHFELLVYASQYTWTTNCKPVLMCMCKRLETPALQLQIVRQYQSMRFSLAAWLYLLNVHDSNVILYMYCFLQNKEHKIVASFAGLPCLQFLIACSMQKRRENQAIKNWRQGRPRNEARWETGNISALTFTFNLLAVIWVQARLPCHL